MKTITLQDLIDQENLMLSVAGKEYGESFKNALDFNALLQTFLKEVKVDAWIFSIFLSQIRKHHTLAIFSSVKLHHTQAMLNLRQILEAGVNAAYAIANQNKDGFVKKRENGFLDAPENFAKKRYDWIEKSYKKHSDFIKHMKGEINKTVAHSNIIYGFQNFDYSKMDKYIFEMPFFDIKDNFKVKTDLWLAGNIALGLMDLFYGVNKDYNLLTFSSDFQSELNKYEQVNKKIKDEFIKTERIQKAMNQKFNKK